MNTYRHSRACAKKFGGKPEDYHAINSFIDSSKLGHGDIRHRALYHHTVGVDLCEKIFGPFILNSANIEVPTKEIAEFHIRTDLGLNFIPTPSYWLNNMAIQEWMAGPKPSNKQKERKVVSFK